MDARKPRVFIVDDERQDLQIHAATLRSQGYDIITADSGGQALRLVESDVPELFLIAAKMKEIDGFSLCERLKQDARLINVPVIFVTADPSSDDIDRGYAAGGVDYIRKPCHLSEFLARVRAHIRLYQLLQEVARLQDSAFDLNPLTRLPGNNTIVTTIQDAIDEGLDMTVIYADLDNFKAYNDYYGFSDGDDLLLFTAETLQTAIRTVCSDGGFLGHVGGDDFVIVVESSWAEELAAKIIQQFDRGAPAFYNDEDANRGMIETTDRQGNSVCYPLASLSLAGVRLRSYDFSRHLEVASVCAEVKHMAKSIQGSVFFMDRRGKNNHSHIASQDCGADANACKPAGPAAAADAVASKDASVSADPCPRS